MKRVIVLELRRSSMSIAPGGAKRNPGFNQGYISAAREAAEQCDTIPSPQ